MIRQLKQVSTHLWGRSPKVPLYSDIQYLDLNIEDVGIKFTSGRECTFGTGLTRNFQGPKVVVPSRQFFATATNPLKFIVNRRMFSKVIDE